MPCMDSWTPTGPHRCLQGEIGIHASEVKEHGGAVDELLNPYRTTRPCKVRTELCCIDILSCMALCELKIRSHDLGQGVHVHNTQRQATLGCSTDTVREGLHRANAKCPLSCQVPPIVAKNTP